VIEQSMARSGTYLKMAKLLSFNQMLFILAFAAIFLKMGVLQMSVLVNAKGQSSVHCLIMKDEDGKLYFSRFYICFHGVKQGWLKGCRKIIGLDACFLTHTCKGQLLTTMDIDANNQMFLIAWVVVGVENNVNWSWFLSLIRGDLNMGDGGRISIISDGHKTCYPTLSTSSVPGTYVPISRRDRVGYSLRGFFWCCYNINGVTFKNGISESFNSRIVGDKGKPIITILEDIRVYIMQRMFCMNKLAFDIKDSITPSVRKLMEYNKRIHREVEVRKGDQSFGVNLNKMKCVCNMWQLSGIPCVHAMAGYMHMKMNPNFRVDEWYYQSKWYEAYQFSIKHVYGPKFWKPTSQPLPLPPVERKMPGRPRKGELDIQQKMMSMYFLGMPPPTATPPTSNIMPPPHTSSSLNTMPPPPTPSPSTSNTMPPPSTSNTMPPLPTPSCSNTMPSHATPGSNTSAGSNTMSSASTGTNKGKCHLIPKKGGGPAKSSASSNKGGSKGGATSRDGSRGGATNRGGSRGGSRGGASKIGRGSNTIPFQGLKDEASDEEHEFKMDIEAVHEMEREQMEIDEDDQFWEEYAREFDHVEEHRAQEKDISMPEDVAAGKQPMTEDEPLQCGANLPTQESIVEANPKPTRSKKSKAAEGLN
nr:hypothetical protein [Tanacetum cinerariifolium]